MLAHPLRFIRITAALIGCALGMAVHAQVNIDAGSLLRQTERDLAAPMATSGVAGTGSATTTATTTTGAGTAMITAGGGRNASPIAAQRGRRTTATGGGRNTSPVAAGCRG